MDPLLIFVLIGTAIAASAFLIRFRFGKLKWDRADTMFAGFILACVAMMWADLLVRP